MHGFWLFLAQKACQIAGCSASIHCVNWADVPDPSERTTGTTRVAGMTRPGLSAWMAGSFHCVMTPVKIFATFSPLSRNDSTRCPPIRRLYMNEVPPATMGM